MLNTAVMISFPQEIGPEERELILQSGKAEKTALNFYLTAEALQIVDSARALYGTKDRTKALEIVLRVFREDRLKKKRR